MCSINSSHPGALLIKSGENVNDKTVVYRFNYVMQWQILMFTSSLPVITDFAL